MGERRYSPGLRRPPPPLTRGVARSEPGILSARTLRGSEGGNAIRQGEGQGRARGAEDVDTIRQGVERTQGDKRGDGAACPCGSSTKIRMRHDSHPTKPPYGRHGGAYKGRWSTTTPTDGVEVGDRGGGEERSRGACGQSVTGGRSGGRTPGRVAERWPHEA